MHHFTDAARAISAGAIREATSRGHKFIGAEHLITGLLNDNNIVSLLNAIGADVSLVKSKLNAHFEEVTKSDGREKQIVAGAIREADARCHSVISVEHIALSMLCDPDGTFCSLLKSAGVDVETFRSALDKVLARHPVSSLPNDAVLRKIPELRPLFLQLDHHQKLKEEAIIQQDFQAAAKSVVETDRLKREIEECFKRLVET